MRGYLSKWPAGYAIGSAQLFKGSEADSELFGHSLFRHMKILRELFELEFLGGRHLKVNLRITTQPTQDIRSNEFPKFSWSGFPVQEPVSQNFDQQVQHSFFNSIRCCLGSLRLKPDKNVIVRIMQIVD